MLISWKKLLPCKTFCDDRKLRILKDLLVLIGPLLTFFIYDPKHRISQNNVLDLRKCNISKFLTMESYASEERITLTTTIRPYKFSVEVLAIFR